MTEIGKRAIAHTLNIYKDRRKQLLDDTRKKASDLYLGLYSLKDIERENYLDRYLILWKISHIKTFQRTMRNVEKPERHQIVFGKSFLRFLEYDGHNFYNTQVAINMLKEYQKILEDMIETSLSWDEGYDRLCVLQKKQEGKFARLREIIEAEENYV